MSCTTFISTPLAVPTAASLPRAAGRAPGWVGVRPAWSAGPKCLLTWSGCTSWPSARVKTSAVASGSSPGTAARPPAVAGARPAPPPGQSDLRPIRRLIWAVCSGLERWSVPTRRLQKIKGSLCDSQGGPLTPPSSDDKSTPDPSQLQSAAVGDGEAVPPGAVARAWDGAARPIEGTEPGR